jgi:hypothetical protein
MAHTVVPHRPPAVVLKVRRLYTSCPTEFTWGSVLIARCAFHVQMLGPEEGNPEFERAREGRSWQKWKALRNRARFGSIRLDAAG